MEDKLAWMGVGAWKPAFLKASSSGRGRSAWTFKAISWTTRTSSPTSYNFTISETQNAESGESFPPQGSLYKALAQLCLNHLCTKRGCCSLVCKDSSPRSSARSFQLEPLPIQSFWPQRDKVPKGLINQCNWTVPFNVMNHANMK